MPILYRGLEHNNVIPLFTENAYEALVQQGRHYWATGSLEGVSAGIKKRLTEETFTLVPPQRYKMPASQAVHSGDWNLLDFLQTICDIRSFRGILFHPPFSGPESLYALDWKRGFRPNTMLLTAIQAQGQKAAQIRAANTLSLSLAS